MFTPDRDDEAPQRLKKNYSKGLSSIRKSAAFKFLARMTRGLLGVHSNRKAPYTFARRHGMSKDMVDVRGRWKNKDGSAASDRYADPEMQALDAQVAAVLCCGGPIR